MERQKNSFQLKEQKKMLPKIHNETEANNLPDKEPKALVIRILSELREEEMNTMVILERNYIISFKNQK